MLLLGLIALDSGNAARLSLLRLLLEEGDISRLWSGCTGVFYTDGVTYSTMVFPAEPSALLSVRSAEASE